MKHYSQKDEWAEIYMKYSTRLRVLLWCKEQPSQCGRKKRREQTWTSCVCRFLCVRGKVGGGNQKLVLNSRKASKGPEVWVEGGKSQSFGLQSEPLQCKTLNLFNFKVFPMEKKESENFDSIRIVLLCRILLWDTEKSLELPNQKSEDNFGLEHSTLQGAARGCLYKYLYTWMSSSVKCMHVFPNILMENSSLSLLGETCEFKVFCKFISVSVFALFSKLSRHSLWLHVRVGNEFLLGFQLEKLLYTRLSCK